MLKLMELVNRRVVEPSNGGLVEFSTRRLVEFFNCGVGRVVESSIRRMVIE